MSKSMFKRLLANDYSDMVALYKNDRELYDLLTDQYGWGERLTEDCLVKCIKKTFWEWRPGQPKYHYHFQGGELWKQDLALALMELDA